MMEVVPTIDKSLSSQASLEKPLKIFRTAIQQRQSAKQ